MAGKVLTAALLKSLAAPTTGRLEVADLRCSGLSLRITSKGVRSWCFRFRDPNDGATSRATIGPYPTVSLAAARERADDMRAEVADGVNPVARKRQDRATAADRTFKALAERYMREHADRNKRPRSAAEDRRNLDLHVLPKWKDRPYADIHRRDVIEIVECLIANGKGTTANRVQALISKIFSFAIDTALREDHPCHRLKKRHKEATGDRVLSDRELPLFWHGILDTRLGKRTGLALRLALLTGARRAEVAGISRAELIDMDSPASTAWLIPAARTKNKRDHLIPLTQLARQTVLDLLAMIGANEQFVIPTQSNRRRGPMDPGSLSQAMAYFAKRLSEVEEGQDAAITSWVNDPPSPHDLRRTLETRMASLGVPKDHRERVLNHTPHDVGSKHYDRHDYLPEKRAALARWNDMLATMLRLPVDGAEVIQLAPRVRVGGE